MCVKLYKCGGSVKHLRPAPGFSGRATFVIYAWKYRIIGGSIPGRSWKFLSSPPHPDRL